MWGEYDLQGYSRELLIEFRNDCIPLVDLLALLGNDGVPFRNRSLSDQKSCEIEWWKWKVGYDDDLLFCKHSLNFVVGSKHDGRPIQRGCKLPASRSARRKTHSSVSGSCIVKRA